MPVQSLKTLNGPARNSPHNSCPKFALLRYSSSERCARPPHGSPCERLLAVWSKDEAMSKKFMLALAFAAVVAPITVMAAGGGGGRGPGGGGAGGFGGGGAGWPGGGGFGGGGAGG